MTPTASAPTFHHPGWDGLTRRQRQHIETYVLEQAATYRHGTVTNGDIMRWTVDACGELLDDVFEQGWSAGFEEAGPG